MNLDGNVVIDYLWEAGIQAHLREKDEDLTVLDFPGYHLDVGRAWSGDTDTEDRWFFDSDDVFVYLDNEFYCQICPESEKDLADSIVSILESL